MTDVTDVTDVSRQDDASSSSSSSSTAAANGQLARVLGPRGAVLLVVSCITPASSLFLSCRR